MPDDFNKNFKSDNPYEFPNERPDIFYPKSISPTFSPEKINIPLEQPKKEQDLNKEKIEKYEQTAEVKETAKVKEVAHIKISKKAQTQTKISKITSTEDPEVLDLVSKALTGNEYAIIKLVKRKYKNNGRKMDEFHDALMEAKQME